MKKLNFLTKYYYEKNQKKENEENLALGINLTENREEVDFPYLKRCKFMSQLKENKENAESFIKIRKKKKNFFLPLKRKKQKIVVDHNTIIIALNGDRFRTINVSNQDIVVLPSDSNIADIKLNGTQIQIEGKSVGNTSITIKTQRNKEYRSTERVINIKIRASVKVLTDSYYKMKDVYPQYFNSTIESTDSGGGGYSRYTVANNLTEIPDILDTSRLTTTQDMFLGCVSLLSIPEMDTCNVKNARGMFAMCGKITSVPNIDLHNATDTSNMFYMCSKLKDISNLDISNSVNVKSMFYCCSELEVLPQLDLKKVNDTTSMFSYCSKLKSTKGLELENVTKAESMFFNCAKLEDISNLDTHNIVNATSMFFNCESLTSIPNLDWSSLEIANEMFRGCNSLTIGPVINSNKITSANGMFDSCSKMVDVPEFNTHNIKNMDSMFSGCLSLPSVFPWAIDMASVDKVIYPASGMLSQKTTDGYNNMFMFMESIYTTVKPAGKAITVKVKNRTGLDKNIMNTYNGVVNGPYNSSKGKYYQSWGTVNIQYV